MKFKKVGGLFIYKIKFLAVLSHNYFSSFKIRQYLYAFYFILIGSFLPGYYNNSLNPVKCREQFYEQQIFINDAINYSPKKFRRSNVPAVSSAVDALMKNYSSFYFSKTKKLLLFFEASKEKTLIFILRRKKKLVELQKKLKNIFDFQK